MSDGVEQRLASLTAMISEQGRLPLGFDILNVDGIRRGQSEVSARVHLSHAVSARSDAAIARSAVAISGLDEVEAAIDNLFGCGDPNVACVAIAAEVSRLRDLTQPLALIAADSVYSAFPAYDVRYQPDGLELTAPPSEALAEGAVVLLLDQTQSTKYWLITRVRSLRRGGATLEPLVGRVRGAEGLLTSAAELMAVMRQPQTAVAGQVGQIPLLLPPAVAVLLREPADRFAERFLSLKRPVSQ